MPPKKGSKAAKKAEEAARRAEEERLAALVEQERLERERLDREEEERRLAEEKRMWLEQEGKRLTEEKILVEPLLTERAEKLLKETQDRAQEEEWENFINCTHLPDVRKESEISTYLALWEEDHDTELQRILKETQQAIEVMIDLDKLISQAMAVKDDALTAKYRGYIDKLRKLVVVKTDMATAHMLEHLDKHINTHDNTCKVFHATPMQKYGIWVNIAKNLRLKSIEYPELGLMTDIPRPIILASVAVRMIHYRKDPLSPFEMGDFFTVGGVLFIEVLDVPDRPKQVKAHVPDVKDPGSWAMSRVLETSGCVERQRYPAVDPITGLVQQVPPMTVHYTLPADILLPKDVTPRIGWWNADKGERGDWDEEGVSEVVLEKKEDGQRVLSLTTMHLTAVAILQSRWSCFPYKSWMLQPMGPNASMLTVEFAGHLLVKFEVGEGRCRLLWPTDEALRPLREKPLPAMQLLQQLRFHGVNLLPCDDDAVHISNKRMDMVKCLKQRPLEERVCQGVSLLAPSFAICCSPLNPTLGEREVCIKLAQSTDYQAAPLQADDPSFKTMMFRAAELDYCFMLEPAQEAAVSSEDGKIYDRDGINLTPPTVGLETKSIPLTAMQELMYDDAATQRCKKSSASYTEEVRVMMDAMRLLSFVEAPLKGDPEQDDPESEAQPDLAAEQEAAEGEGGAEAAEGGAEGGAEDGAGAGEGSGEALAKAPSSAGEGGEKKEGQAKPAE